jgi:hypothetical protein
VLYRILADFILVIHLLFVSFVVLGFGLILVGIWRKWTWTHNRVFRNMHLVAIAVVVLQAWFGRLCLLTEWENQLREMAGEAGYSQTFIGYWLQKMLFYEEVEPWVFTTIYTVFGLLVFVCWLASQSNSKSK